MRLFRPLLFSRWIYPDCLFRIKAEKKSLCLTFDDGPDPGSTMKILNILEKNNTRAIFFCSGKAAEKYPELIKLIREKGHLVGNHGYEHLDGGKSPVNKYIENVAAAVPFTSGNLFRPPYGRLTPGQYKKLRDSYKIVLWDVMPYDFDISFGAENSYRILKRKIRPGSIIVFHDTPRSTVTMFLENFIIESISMGYDFSVIE